DVLGDSENDKTVMLQLPCELVVTVKCEYRGESYTVVTRYSANGTIPAGAEDYSEIKWGWYWTWQGE
ncbi:MAG: hypothetical protein WCQ72_08030, partial [Eubacteriales bacterium]